MHFTNKLRSNSYPIPATLWKNLLQWQFLLRKLPYWIQILIYLSLSWINTLLKKNSKLNIINSQVSIYHCKWKIADSCSFWLHLHNIIRNLGRTSFISWWQFNVSPERPYLAKISYMTCFCSINELFVLHSQKHWVGPKTPLKNITRNKQIRQKNQWLSPRIYRR